MHYPPNLNLPFSSLTYHHHHHHHHLTMTSSSSLLSYLTVIVAAGSFVDLCLGSLYRPPPQLVAYHHGPLLEGTIPLSILYYGHFSPSQKSIINDFIRSLTPPPQHSVHPAVVSVSVSVSVSKWWRTVDVYLRKAGRTRRTNVRLSSQISDPTCSLGKSLTRSHLSELAAALRPEPNGVSVVLTADDVTVESFCVSACGLHGSSAEREAYVWVGNSARQCPGQCAWPFHEPAYGPAGFRPVGPPNGDVGVDGMVVNLGTLLAGAVTNPFGDGFYEGPAGAAVEVAGACVGVYGEGAYPGYPGELRVDAVTGGSYNVEGVRGRKYLVPTMLDPRTFTCSPPTKLF